MGPIGHRRGVRAIQRRSMSRGAHLVRQWTEQVLPGLLAVAAAYIGCEL
jgi:hypothetical protein